MKLDNLITDLGEFPTELLALITDKALSYDWNEDQFNARERVFYGTKQVEAYCGHYLKIHETCVLDKSLLEYLNPVVAFLEKNLKFKKIKVYKCTFACMPPGSVISVHADPFWFTHLCHRIHIPVIENDKSYHIWFDENMKLNPQKMVRGRFYDFNNDIIHSGINEADNDQERIHLILDVIDEQQYEENKHRMRLPLDFLVEKNMNALTYCRDNPEYRKFFNQQYFDSVSKYWNNRPNK